MCIFDCLLLKFVLTLTAARLSFHGGSLWIDMLCFLRVGCTFGGFMVFTTWIDTTKMLQPTIGIGPGLLHLVFSRLSMVFHWSSELLLLRFGAYLVHCGWLIVVNCGGDVCDESNGRI